MTTTPPPRARHRHRSRCHHSRKRRHGGIDRPSRGRSMPSNPTSFVRAPTTPNGSRRSGDRRSEVKEGGGRPGRRGDMSGGGHPIGSRRYKSLHGNAANDKQTHARQRVTSAAGKPRPPPIRAPSRPTEAPASRRAFVHEWSPESFTRAMKSAPPAIRLNVWKPPPARPGFTKTRGDAPTPAANLAGGMPVSTSQATERALRLQAPAWTTPPRPTTLALRPRTPTQPASQETS